MKNSLILLPLLLILAIVIFSILMSQAISKEIENTIINKNSFVEERIDDIRILENTRYMVPKDGIEPTTQRFSVACSTN